GRVCPRRAGVSYTQVRDVSPIRGTAVRTPRPTFAFDILSTLNFQLSTPHRYSPHVPVVSTDFIDALRQIVGVEGTISNPDELLVYECDAFTMEKNLPNVVVLPRSTDEVVAVVKVFARECVPIIPRGAGTSLSGGVLPVDGGVMIALTRMNRVLNVDYENRRALVEAGCVNAWITNAVKSRGLLYAP